MEAKTEEKFMMWNENWKVLPIQGVDGIVISLLVLRTGCGIWLYPFLIIAYLSTLDSFCTLLEFHALQILAEIKNIIITIVPKGGWYTSVWTKKQGRSTWTSFVGGKHIEKEKCNEEFKDEIQKGIFRHKTDEKSEIDVFLNRLKFLYRV